MSETKSSTPPNPAQSESGLLKKEWALAKKILARHNGKRDGIEAKVATLLLGYREVEKCIKPQLLEFFYTDLLDPKVDELIRALENGTYKPAPRMTLEDALKETNFENLIEETS